MKNLKYSDITKNWEAVYIGSADKLYFTDIIPKNSMPVSGDENVTLYYTPDRKLKGIIVDNFARAYYSSKKFKSLIDYLKRLRLRLSHVR